MSRHQEQLPVGHAHAHLVLFLHLVRLAGQEGRRHGYVRQADAVLGVDDDVAVAAAQENVVPRRPDDVFAVETRALGSVHENRLVGREGQIAVHRGDDAVGLREADLDFLDALGQAEIREVRGEDGRAAARILDLERVDLRDRGAVSQDLEVRPGHAVAAIGHLDVDTGGVAYELDRLVSEALADASVQAHL